MGSGPLSTCGRLPLKPGPGESRPRAGRAAGGSLRRFRAPPARGGVAPMDPAGASDEPQPGAAAPAPLPAGPFDVVVLGGGAAGLWCAGTAAARGRRVLLLEKNRRVGVKIL